LVRLDIAARLQPRPAWWWEGARWSLVRKGGAVAVTIPEQIRGFRGWRVRWWDRTDEQPFSAWQEVDTRQMVLLGE
jgi:hypothetical protein